MTSSSRTLTEKNTDLLSIVLIQPEIPPNTGNIARLCAASDCPLHLVGPINFDLSDKAVKRAGLDYWNLVNMTVYDSLESYLSKLSNTSTLHFFSSHATTAYYDVSYKSGDQLIFGSETKGLPKQLLEQFPERYRTIPMKNKAKGVRSINLATAVGIVLFEGLRQLEHTKKIHFD